MPDDGAGGDAAPSPGRPTGDALWDDWDTPPRVPSAPVLHLDGFDGPIDLLLDLAERQQLDLGRISMVDLVDQFVAASARVAAHVSIERRADWLVMAAHLVLLCARLLFPATPAAAADAELEAEHEIVRLDELRFVRAAAAWLQARPQLGHDVFARPPRGPDPRAASYMALMEACLTVLRGRDELAEAEAVYRPAIPYLFRIPEALIRMRALIAEMSEPRPLGDFLPVVPHERRGKTVVVRSAVALTFVAALELCRGAVVGLDQEEVFGTINVLPRFADASVADAAPVGRER
jgi:segregation and condensation protein A